jgi:hypothetical protein
MRFATCCAIAGNWSAGSRIRARNGCEGQAKSRLTPLPEKWNRPDPHVRLRDFSGPGFFLSSGFFKT